MKGVGQRRPQGFEKNKKDRRLNFAWGAPGPGVENEYLEPSGRLLGAILTRGGREERSRSLLGAEKIDGRAPRGPKGAKLIGYVRYIGYKVLEDLSGRRGGSQKVSWRLFLRPI